MNSNPIGVFDSGIGGLTIDGVVKKAVKSTKSNVIGIIGTQATISSKSYRKAIKNLNPKIKIISQACSLFVPC